MNFMQLLNSLDEFLYEVMSWLIFYPVTMWRTLRHPLRMMAYADSELQDSAEEQYTDTLRPPLFLLISLVLSHLIELALIGDSPIVKDTNGLAGMIDDDTSLLLMRLVALSLFPLVMATRLVRKQRVGLTRNSLREPFYSQCYVAAPFALVVGLSATLVQCRWPWAHIVAVGLLPVALVPYGVVQSIWFARTLRISYMRGFLNASIAMVESLVMIAILSKLFI